MYQFSGKIHAPISQNMRGQQNVHRRGTDRQTDRVKPVYPPNFFFGGYNEFSLVFIICTNKDITFNVAQSVDGQARNPWVAGSNLAPALKSRLIHVVLRQSHRF